jgi:hypothetical protein
MNHFFVDLSQQYILFYFVFIELQAMKLKKDTKFCTELFIREGFDLLQLIQRSRATSSLGLQIMT